MAKSILTATEVRNNFFVLLDSVAKTGKPIYIKKDLEHIKGLKFFKLPK